MYQNPLFEISELANWNLDKLVKTESDKQAVAEGCYFDPKPVLHVLNFLHGQLRIYAIRLGGDVPYPLIRWFVEDIIIPFFGWRRPDGRRRFKKLDAYVPKKNGKSTNVGALLVYLHTYAPPKHHMCNMALSKDQGGLIFREYASLIGSNKYLEKRFNIRHSWMLATNEKTDVRLQTISAEVENKEGFNYWVKCYDEKHVSLDHSFVETMKYAGVAFPDPIELGISTAGDDINTVSYQDYTHSKQILAGEVINTTTLPVVYEIPQDRQEDFQLRNDFAEYVKCNPSLGFLFTEDELRHEFNEAMRGNILDKTSFYRYRGDIWVESVSAWLDVGEYDKCHTPENAKSYPKPGAMCYVGIDTTSRRDLAAVSFFFPETLSVFTLYYLTQYSLDKFTNVKIKDNFRKWILESRVKLVVGNMIRYEQIFDDIMEYLPSYKVKGIGCDPYNAADLTVRFGNSKYKDLFKTVKQTRQNISPAISEVEDYILTHKINCYSDPVFRHMLVNLRIAEDANGNKMPHKAKSLAKIDGISALLNGVALFIEDYVTGKYTERVVKTPRAIGLRGSK